MIPIKQSTYLIKVYQLKDGRAPFSIWAKKLDKSIRARIHARIARFVDGHLGDCKFLGPGLFEARFFFGAGYRVYFSILGDEIILLLLGGDKASQNRDVALAKEFLRSYLEDHHANKKP